MTGRTYSIIRSSRRCQKTVNTVLEQGLSWETADSRRNQLAANDRAEHPLRSSWSRDVFVVQMELAGKPSR